MKAICDDKELIEFMEESERQLEEKLDSLIKKVEENIK